jgi:inhibitor of KinA sporulation pathway (predicted exonuclease)
MVRISIDLEMNQPSGRIIAIGAVAFNDNGIVDTFHEWVNPNEPLNDFIRTLCHVDVDLGSMDQLDDVYDKFKIFVEKHGCHRQAIAWGGGDCRTLKQQISASKDWCLGRTEMNVKCLVQAILHSRGVKVQGGLSKSLGKFGLKFQGTKHRADSDALNTALLYLKIISLFKDKL